jgi:dipeptidyl-peptidase-4
VAFVRKNDLYTVDLEPRQEKRLTTDGADHVFNGRLDWVYEEELASRTGRAYEWAPDSSAIAYLRLDETRVDSYPIVDFLKVPAGLTNQRYPKAGAANSVVSFHVVGTDGSPRGEVKFEADVYVEPAFSWTPDSKSVCFRVLNRAQDRHEIRLPHSGGRRDAHALRRAGSLLDQRHRAAEVPRETAGTWKSERDGFCPSLRGQRLRRRAARDHERALDRGPRGRRGRGEKARVFHGDRGERAPARALPGVLDGSGFAKLPLPAGTHSADLSADGSSLLDTYSTVSKPPVVSLLDSAGKTLRVVDQPENRLGGYELATNEEIEISADDGTKLMARLLKPADFDPSKKYPVIVYVYGGPHAQVVRDSWSPGSLFDHYLASKGFLIWSLDNRGSWGRGHAWETAIFKETGKKELADQLAGVKYLKSLSYVDPARIGIWGWSYGGYMTLYALTNAPDVWKCGVAGAPVTHWKFYDSIYTERYMRTPKDNPAGYEASAPLSRAKDLKAKLLLIHGTADDNVHMQNTLSFVDALTKAGRPYQLEIQPGQKHGFRGKESLNFRNATMARFFEDNL